MKRCLLTLAIVFAACRCAFAVCDPDTNIREPLDTIVLQEVRVSALKNGVNLRNQPQASTSISSKELGQLNIVAIKGVSDVVPNLFIPDYGSRITSSIYVRGLGARMDNPSVGLNVDNVPILNKDAYDFDISDIVRVDMIRGPQSTLYGRNTMGGVINISTLSPLSYKGLRLFAEGGSGNYWKLNGAYYFRPWCDTGVALSVGYSSLGGLFRNEYNGEKIDKERSLSGRLRLDHRFSDRVSMQNVLSVSNLRQGGYPYESMETGKIEYNDTCFYRRFWLSDGLTVNWNAPGFKLTSITSVQHINDNMTLDQDFLPLDYFTLSQRKHETSVTQDFVAKWSRGNFNWLAGIFGFYKDMDMKAPVTFYDYGIRTLIENHVNEVAPTYPIYWDSRSFPLNSDFGTRTFGIAAYGRGEWNLADKWHLSLGLRIDYERAKMKYHSFCNTSYTIYHPYPEVYKNVSVLIDDTGRLANDFMELLPSLGLVYDLPFDGSNLYLNITKGYKAGGFNTQMFSDVLQQRLMSTMGIGGNYAVEDIVEYDPEKSWNYEVGAHLSFPTLHTTADIALFYIDCRDQQLTMFPDGTTTGRIMTNAGKTRSCGGELQVGWTPMDCIKVNASYGYTNAKFRTFWNGQRDFAGMHIPYAPINTLFLQGVWTQPVNLPWLDMITVDVNMRGVGKIYWNESNTASQNFYALLGASLTFSLKNCDLQIWGENLADTRYHTFYFMSIGNEFVQRGRPLRIGATLRVNIQ